MREISRLRLYTLPKVPMCIYGFDKEQPFTHNHNYINRSIHHGKNWHSIDCSVLVLKDVVPLFRRTISESSTKLDTYPLGDMCGKALPLDAYK